MKIRQISSLGSFALLWAVLPIHAAVQPVSFGAKTDFGTGDFPNSVAVGEFNGDGQLDLATANGGAPDNVSILLGTGTGSFGAKTDFGAGVDAESVADSVEDFDFGTRETTGFLFQRYEAGEMMAVLRRALTAWRQPPVWRELMRRGMAQDFSWRVSADAYDRLYDDALEKVKSAGPITLDKVRALRWTPLRGSTRSKSSTGASEVPRSSSERQPRCSRTTHTQLCSTVEDSPRMRYPSSEQRRECAAQHLLEPPDRSLRLLHSEPLSIHSALSGSRRRKPREEGTLRD